MFLIGKKVEHLRNLSPPYLCFFSSSLFFIHITIFSPEKLFKLFSMYLAIFGRKTFRRTCSIYRIPRLQSARLNSQRVHFCTLELTFASSTTIYLRFIDIVSETRLLLYRLYCTSSLAVSSRLNFKKICGSRISSKVKSMRNFF